MLLSHHQTVSISLSHVFKHSDGLSFLLSPLRSVFKCLCTQFLSATEIPCVYNKTEVCFKVQ